MHNPMMDERGDVWFTSRIGNPENPAFCQKGSSHPSAQVFPIKESTRQLAYYNAKTGDTKLIRTCFNTHHVVFAEDKDNTIWLSAGGPQQGALGWVNRRIFEETGDEQKAQGWTPIVLDTNGDGKRGEYVEPNQPVDPTKDKRINGGFYGIGYNPVDGTIWGNRAGLSRLHHPGRPRLRSVQDRSCGNLRAAVPGLRAARLRHRPQRRRLGAAVQRPSRHLRPPQVQGPAQRTEGRRRQAVPRGLDARSVPRSAVQERC